jgi:membrane-associated phospholipid phosphatase
MTAAIATIGHRYLPRGWSDLFRQLGIWFGFVLAYQVARGIADRNPAKAFSDGLGVINFEKHAHSLFELSLQRLVDSSHFLATLTFWTYWLSQFAVLGIAMLWVYLRKNDYFKRFRNTVLLANSIGLIGYVLVPTAPPRMYPDFGFQDTLALFGLNHGSGAIQLASNQFAAMPSLHAADSLIVGVMFAFLCRRKIFKVLWLMWPGWVWFSVMATGNHFWLDCLAGAGCAAVAAGIVYAKPIKRRLFGDAPLTQTA